MQVERERLGHAVLAVVRGEVVMPLPDFAGEGGLHVDLDLLDVEVLAQDLLRRLDQARMAHQLGEQGIAQVQAHGGAHLVALPLADVGRRVLGIERGQARAQGPDLVAREQPGQDEEPVPVEALELIPSELHGTASVSAAGTAPRQT